MDVKTFQFSSISEKTNWKKNLSIVILLSWKTFPSKIHYYGLEGFPSSAWLVTIRDEFIEYTTDVSKMHSNEAFYISSMQVKVKYSLPRAYVVFCGRCIITVNWDYL